MKVSRNIAQGPEWEKVLRWEKIPKIVTVVSSITSFLFCLVWMFWCSCYWPIGRSPELWRTAHPWVFSSICLSIMNISVGGLMVGDIFLVISCILYRPKSYRLRYRLCDRAQELVRKEWLPLKSFASSVSGKVILVTEIDGQLESVQIDVKNIRLASPEDIGLMENERVVRFPTLRYFDHNNLQLGSNAEVWFGKIGGDNHENQMEHCARKGMGKNIKLEKN